MVDALLVSDGERLERADVDVLASVGRDANRQLVGALLANPSVNVNGLAAFILGGFEITNPSAKICQVTRGAAILASKEQGQIVLSSLTSEGPASLAPDLAAYANGTYGVYIRFESTDGAVQNRVFWDPLAVAEFSQAVATRRLASWGVNVSLLASPPGGEWFQIGQVVVSAAPTLAVTKQRHLFFEGNEGASYASGWGGGTTRNADRGTYGVRDLQTFAAAVTQKLADMEGHAWYAATAEPLNNKVSKSGDTLNGVYSVTGASLNLASTNVNVSGQLNVSGQTYFQQAVHAGAAWDVGTALSPFGSIYGTTLYAHQAVLEQASSAAGDQLVLMGDNSGGTLAGITFKRNAGDTAQMLTQLYDPTGVGGFPGLLFTSTHNADKLTLFLKNSGGSFKSYQWGDGYLKTETHVWPWTDSLFDVGDPTRKWRSIYAQNVYAYTGVYPDVAGGAEIGNASLPFGFLYAQNARLATAVGIGTLGSPATYLQATSGRFGTGADPLASPGWRFNGTVEVGGDVVMDATSMISTPTLAGGASTGVLRVEGSSPVSSEPVAYWERNFGASANQTIWKFRHHWGAGGGDTAPQNQTGVTLSRGTTETNETQRAIIQRTNGYALRCQVFDGTNFVDVWLLAYNPGNLPG